MDDDPTRADEVRRYVTTKAAAGIAGVAPKSIRRWVHQGRLRAHWAGRLLRIRLDELEAFLAVGSARDRVETADSIATRLLSRRKGA